MSDSDKLAKLQGRIDDLERALAAVPGGIVQVSPLGAITIASEQACRFLGLNYDELTASYTVDFAGKTYNEDGSDCPPSDYPVSRCLMTGEPQAPRTIGVEQPSGEVRWGVFTAIPQEMPGGRGAVVTFVDITERKAAEDGARAMAVRLQLADRLASVGSLAAGVAHEINNPLTYVLGNLARVADQLPRDGEVGMAVEQAREGAQRVARIVRDLSRFARVSDGKSEPFDVRIAIEAAAAMARAEFRHRAELELKLDEVPFVLGQQERAVQVFVNLLVNAAQSIEAGNTANNQVVVEVTSQQDEVVVSIRDTGCGISDAVRERVLEPFFTTKPVGGGSGLGLTISQEIVSGMAGDLQIASVEGEGTTVTVRLPSTTQNTFVDATTADVEVQPGFSVLVVDDEPSILSLVRWILREQDVTLAANGRDALAACSGRRFDLVLCDLMMPDMTGMDLYESVSETNAEQAERFVFLTGGAFTPRARSFLEEHGARVLRKPFGIKELQIIVAEYASR